MDTQWNLPPFWPMLGRILIAPLTRAYWRAFFLRDTPGDPEELD